MKPFKTWAREHGIVLPEKPKRLTLYTRKHYANEPYCVAVVLDRMEVQVFYEQTEPEARAAAQAYVDELLAHFRAGGE